MPFQLRTYSYLDEEVVDDFLAQLEGAPTEGQYMEKERNSGEESALDISPSLETQRNKRDTLLVKITRLFELLERDDRILSLDKPEMAAYDLVKIRSIVEISGSGRLPKWETMRNDLASASRWVRIMQAAGQDLLSDANTQLGYEMLPQLLTMGDTQELSIILAPKSRAKLSSCSTLED